MTDDERRTQALERIADALETIRLVLTQWGEREGLIRPDVERVEQVMQRLEKRGLVERDKP